MSIKSIIKRIILKERRSSEAYIEYLRKQGVEIGEDCNIFVPTRTVIDAQNPCMLKIGNHVRITDGVKILTHDYSWSVIKRYAPDGIMPGKIIGAVGSVEIGNNVFIGMNAIITKDVKIGDNVIIGAGSVVTKDCLSNAVYAGNPARRIMDIKDFYLKRESKQLEEAKAIAIRYRERFNKIPPKEIFAEYFMLFEGNSDVSNSKCFWEKVSLCNNSEETLNYMQVNSSKFKNYEEFLTYCFTDI